MNKEYGYTKQVESHHQGSKHTLAILMSKLRSSLGAAWEQPRSSLEYAYSMLMTTFLRPFSSKRAELERRLASDEITSRPSRDYGSCPTRLRLTISLLLMLTLGSVSVWGQTNYSGTYFMAMPGTGSYDSETIENNYYLVPTEGWCYFVTPNSVQAEDNGQPFLTTYKCGHVKKAKWIIQKHTTENKYYIIHLADGKYLTYNVQLSGAGENRVRVHLEASITGDNNLFTITKSGNNYFISPGTGQYLNVTDGNKNSYAGASGKNDGPTGYKDVSGIIGRWNQNNNTSQFRLEPTSSIDAPTITDNNDGTFTIAAASGATIYYTTDGSIPTTTSYTGTGTTSVNIDQTESMTVIKAIAKAASDAVPTDVTTFNLPACETPIITFDYTTSNVSITCATPNSNIYYTTDGSTPTSSSTLYSAPFSVSSSTTVKAIATKSGIISSAVAELAITQVATPTIQNNGSNAISITSTTPGATFYYTTDGTDPTTSSAVYNSPLTDNVSNVTIKAIAVKENMIPSAVGSGSVKLKCATPVITRDGMTFTLSCSMPTDANLYYTLGGGSETSYSGPVAFTADQLPITVTAVARHSDYNESEEASFELNSGSGTPEDPYLIYGSTDFFNFVTNVNNGTTASASYKLGSDVSASGADAITTAFTGTFDGGGYTISNLGHPLFNTVDGGVIKNVILDAVSISGGANTGAIANKVTGTSAKMGSVYSCGVLSGNVSGSGYVGSIVGQLGDSDADNCYARVINCFSYATVSGGSDSGGIVGYNSFASTAANIRTMVMNCMYYGDITGGTNVSPVYGGEIINNLQGGLSNFNYYAYTKLTTATINKYNNALSIEDKFLNRFEYYRLLLNSNKRLAAFYATGSHDNANQKMLKWVLETADRTIDNPKPYPVLKTQGYYPSIINPDIEHAPDSASVGRNHGGKLGKTLTVHIGGVGSNAPDGASIRVRGAIQLQRTDKDFDRFNFNYDKVQLPYYNDVGTGNYTGNKVVTGWKITAITAVPNDPYTSDNYPTTGITDYPNHNYADRKSSNKDLYSVSKRVFSQGAYFDVPYGVTSITIEPYWGNAIYVADQYYDVVYKNDYTGKQGVSQVGTQVVDNTTEFNGQKIRTSITGLGSGTTVYDNAVVLVGNFHLDNVPSGGTVPFTMMSVDEDNDHEPDYSLIYHHKGRTAICPIRFDFLNIPGTAQAQKPNGASLICNFTIFKTKGWFEVTNTSSFYTSQLEYENQASLTKSDAPLILLGGVIDQFVSTQSSSVDGHTIYIHLGSNVWINEFGMGTHSDGSQSTPHVPVSVTGGEFPGFYLTGTYKADATVRNDNAECYISGGYIHEAAGASLEQIGGNVRWQIYNADIENFFGGGINDAKPIKGDITTDIYNSHVTLFCGGPKFGNMQTGKKVSTNAEGCTFGKYFGAGYGGLSYSKKKYYDKDDDPVNWTTQQSYYTNDRGKYYDGKTTELKQGATSYGFKGPGVATDFDYEYFVWTSGKTGGRFYVKFASFSLAQCNDVSSTLKKCTIENNFYGGGNLGKVVGTATSILEDCTVKGNVYGAGYSASIPTVEVRDAGFTKNPNYNSQSGMFEPGVFSGTTTFTWQNATAAGKTLTNGQSGSDLTNHILYTDIELTGLGEVAKTVLTIDGTTTVTESVYGGGEESNVSGDTRVNISGGTIAQNVYGGGKGVADEFACTKAMIGIDGAGANNTNPEATKDKGTKVNISDGTVNGNVYGGGEVGRVEWNTQVTIGEENGTGEPVVEGYVFGAGKGLKTHGYAALVRGNPTVIIQGNAKIKKSVYGGGEIASVARYKVASTAEEAAENGVEIGMPYALANNYSGNCKVIVGGKAVIGPDSPMKMYHPEITDGSDKPDDAGHVFGAGKGVLPEVYTYEDNEHRPKRMLLYNAESLPGEGYWEYVDAAHKNIWEYFKDEDSYFAFVKTLALSSKTEVTIKDNAFVKGSVYGGSENGLVQFDTDVKIQGGQIGCGKDTTEPYGDEVWANDYTPSGDLECASWDYGKDTNGDGKKDQYAPYDPYAKYLNPADKKYYYDEGFTKYAEGGANIATDGHTYYGNVFGGGSGSVPYLDTQQGVSRYVSSAGIVKGNTKVTISGGHILTNVYGGCEATNVLGSATITMTGGTVGVPRTLEQIVAHPVTCYIFGAGKGDQRIFFNKETNVDRTTVSIEGGKVYGSVFGGGEDGHVFQNTTVNIGTTEGEGPTIGTLGTSYVDGNVFGGGRGFSGDALTAGNVGGSVELNIKSGKILGSVYGGGRLASVGYGLYLVDEKIKEDGDSIKPYGILRPDDKYDGSYPDPSTDPASTYYDKGRGYITINISGGTIGNDHEYIYNPTAEQKAKIPNTTFDYQNHLQYTKGGNVFTGGMGRLYALDNTTLLPLWPKLGKCKGTTLNMTGGTVKSSIYGGGEIGAVAENATVNINGGTVGTKVVDPNDATKYYYFGSVFGGGKGSTAKVEGISEAGTTGGNVEVNLNQAVASDDSKKGAIVHQVFGCNDMNGSPKGTVTVHVYATQNADKVNISTKYDRKTNNYDVETVYGGGNLAAYEPAGGKSTTKTTKVIIDGCGLTSIKQVYGGGNAASTPATNVEVNGTYEIMELFGGGNGFDKLPDGKPNPGANVGYKNYTVYEKVAEEWVAKDDPAYDTKEERTAPGSAITYGTGQASVNVFGGTVHRVFGGSNTKGNVRQTAVTLLDENSGCSFCVDEAYGGGKSALMDAEAKLHMACIPGLQAAYGGAEAAAIKGNVTLNITNGTFDRVFGGNNLSGTIDGSITVNIQEVGCRPIKIGELYGGGNQAGYSVYGYNDDDTPKETGTKLYDDPQVNVMSFTSIGKVFGGGFGSGATMVGNPTVNVNEVYGKYYNDDKSIVPENAETPNHYPIPSHAKGKMGAIHTVFGGGNAAKVMGNTTVNIATQEEVYIVKQVSVGSDVSSLYTRSGAGTTESPFIYTDAEGTAADGTTYYEKQDVLGADIRGDVYGGGNNAEVTGDAKVKIGKKNE